MQKDTLLIVIVYKMSESTKKKNPSQVSKAQ